MSNKIALNRLFIRMQYWVEPYDGEEEVVFKAGGNVGEWVWKFTDGVMPDWIREVMERDMKNRMFEQKEDLCEKENK
jgi:isocitrate dehydrogenase